MPLISIPKPSLTLLLILKDLSKLHVTLALTTQLLLDHLLNTHNLLKYFLEECFYLHILAAASTHDPLCCWINQSQQSPSLLALHLIVLFIYKAWSIFPQPNNLLITVKLFTIPMQYFHK